MVKAVVPKGKSRGTYIGRLARVRASGAFSIRTKSGLVGKSHRYCQVIQHVDGYNYTIGDAVSLYRRPRLGIPHFSSADKRSNQRCVSNSYQCPTALP